MFDADEHQGGAPASLDELLSRVESGDSRAEEELLPDVHDELHRLARRAMASQPPGATLQTTALVNEAWLKLAPGRTDYQGREHFLAVAARAMRSVLVDHARKRGASKRGGGAERLELDEAVGLFEERSNGGLLELDCALDELERADPELARIVELRFFGGMKHPEISRRLDIPLRTVERGWQMARAWLHSKLSDGDGD